MHYTSFRTGLTLLAQIGDCGFVRCQLFSVEFLPASLTIACRVLCFSWVLQKIEARPMLLKRYQQIALRFLPALAILVLGVFEPLACIFHCEFIHGLHHDKTSALVDANGKVVLFCELRRHPGVLQSGVTELAVLAATTTTNHPTSPLPQPFHELVLLTVVLLASPLLATQPLRTRRQIPVSLTLPPPLPPPICFAV